MDNAEVSQNVILAVIAAPLIAAIVDVLKNYGPRWATAGMVPALIAEAIGVVLGVVAYASHSWLYQVPPQAAPAFYIATGFAVGLAAVGLQAQYKAGVHQDIRRETSRGNIPVPEMRSPKRTRKKRTEIPYTPGDETQPEVKSAADLTPPSALSLLAAVVLIGALMLGGCAALANPGAGGDLRVKAMQSVIVATDVYDIVMISLGQLYQAKLLGATIEENNQNRDRAVEWANKYRAAALRVAAGVEGGELDSAIAEMQNAITMLRNILSRFNIGALDLMQRQIDRLATARLEGAA